MPGPRVARALGLAALAGLVAAGAAPGQNLLPLSDAWTWTITASPGLVGREVAAWRPIHSALQSGGWDNRYPAGCGFFCPNAAQIVEGRPVAPVVAVRRRVGGRFQARLVASLSTPGRYPGLRNSVPLTVTPTVLIIGTQGAASFGPFWLAAGPGWYAGRARTAAAGADTSASRSGVGFVLGGGIAVPRHGRLFFEGAVERRFAGSVDMPSLAVPGQTPVPAMSVPLSHTLLSVGVGFRL